MLEQILLHLRNWFDRTIVYGTFTIEDGVLKAGGETVGFLQNDQYFRIVGSVFNDGLHQWPDNLLTDETFVGSVWCLAIPRQVIELSAEISEWMTKYGDVVNGPYESESFSDYSYTRASSGSGSNGSPSGWQSVFRSRLNPWRKI